MKCLIRLFFVLIILGLLQTGCDRIPEEGTIVYDVEFPRADEVDTGGGGGVAARPQPLTATALALATISLKQPPLSPRAGPVTTSRLS